MRESIRPFEGAPTLFPPGPRSPWPWPLRIVTGLLFSLVGLLAWREFEPLVFFRPVDGVVVYSYVDKVRVTGRRARRWTRYAPTVIYRYVANGQTFSSAQFARTQMLGARSDALSESLRYVKGTRVQAWYNPSQPAEAVLSRAPNPVLLAILAAVGIMVWLFAMSQLATPPRPAGSRVVPAVPPPIG